MIEMLKKLFGTPEETKQDSAPPKSQAQEKTSAPAEIDQEGIEEFVGYVVRSLVDAPESVSIDSEEKDSVTTIKICCEKPDIGKVIGKKGRTISAIRALANGAGGRIGQRVNVEVED